MTTVDTDPRVRRRADLLALAGLAAAAVAVRLVGLREETADMRIFERWMAQLARDGIDTRVGNYNVPLQYLFAVLAYVPGAAVVKVKLTWAVFDALLVWAVYRLARALRPGRRAVAAAATVALLPTVVVNSSVWGQCDAVWAAPVVGGLARLLRGHPWSGVALVGLGVAVKPQAAFVLPVLLLLALAGRLPWRTLPVLPAVFLALAVPALLAGRDPVSLLSVYTPAAQARVVPALTQHAPSVYTFLPVTTRLDTVRGLGYAFALALVPALCWAVLAGRRRLSPARVLGAAALCAVAVPWLLPGMHERYFYLADVLTVVLVVCRPRLWYVPVLVQAASLGSYLRFLFVGDADRGPFPPMPLLAVLMLLAALAVGHDLLVTPGRRRGAARPAPAPARPA